MIYGFTAHDAFRATNDLARSALPNAPVKPAPAARRRSLRRLAVRAR